MASLGGNTSLLATEPELIFAGILGVLLFAVALLQLFPKQAQESGEEPGPLGCILLFCYSCFFKPHSKDPKGSQQDALESFYSSQAGIYDATRETLLKGREDMLALAAAQLLLKAKPTNGDARTRRVWVDVRLCVSRAKKEYNG